VTTGDRPATLVQSVPPNAPFTVRPCPPRAVETRVRDPFAADLVCQDGASALIQAPIWVF